EANSRSPPHVDDLAVSNCPADTVEAVAKGDVITHGDAEIARLVIDGSLKRGQPFLGAFFESVGTAGLQGVDEVEQEYAGRDIREKAFAVANADCSGPVR